MALAEAELVRRAQAGEQDAFVALYESNYVSVYNYAYYRVHDAAIAGDIAGEVFARMVAKIDRFTYTDRPILAWLYTIARNLVVDYQRRQQRQGAEPIYDLLVSREPGPLEQAASSLTRRDLSGALQHLTDEQQQVILLKFVEGHSNAEVGQRLGKSEGAVKSLQHRALASLRRVLVREYGYEEQPV